jgi:hypothetical protein
MKSVGGFMDKDIEDRFRRIEEDLASLKQSIGVRGPNSSLGALMSLNQITADLRERQEKMAFMLVALIKSLPHDVAVKVWELYRQDKSELLARDKSAFETLDSIFDK